MPRNHTIFENGSVRVTVAYPIRVGKWPTLEVRPGIVLAPTRRLSTRVTPTGGRQRVHKDLTPGRAGPS